MSQAHKQWLNYCQQELRAVEPILDRYGFKLDEKQPHLKGERFLQQAVTTKSGRKLILLGRQAGRPVVIKATTDKNGQAELLHERICRQVLNQINFAGEVFNTPPEIAFLEEDGFVISIQGFIEQDKNFLERSLSEQFALALGAFKAQESAHATTYKHRKLITHTYGMRESKTYLQNFANFKTQINTTHPESTPLKQSLDAALTFLTENERTIEQYSGFLTHTDFVPHNFRVHDHKIYLLDYSSLIFGNKHEGWARFLNFMTLYNQPLEQAFLDYLKHNRSSEEQLSLKLMRIYRLGEIIAYYTDKLPLCDGNLYKLNSARVDFWQNVLTYVLEDKKVPSEVIINYQTLRDSLRSEDEKERQRDLH